ncbi:hypothetical protein BDZ91DRAFT_121554 [Kalaharituber pfeilii]|nr:hypothetical protein BDZ91DRAFT_121554 [Kalaharituber pfeilii]
MANLVMFVPQLPPLLARGQNSPVVHWAGNIELLQAGTAEAEEIWRPGSPEYYSSEHRQRDKGLERQFKMDLKALRRKKRDDLWQRLWNLHKDFRNKYKESFLDEKHTLEIVNDEVAKRNVQDKFAADRRSLIDGYTGDKWMLPVDLALDHDLEVHNLRIKYLDDSIQLRKEAKSAFHREIFNKILASGIAKEPTIDQTSLNTAFVAGEEASSSVQAVSVQDPAPLSEISYTQGLVSLEQQASTQESSAQVASTLETSTQETQLSLIQPVEAPVLSDIPERAISVASKISADSKKSTAPANSRSEQSSLPSTLRLQEIPFFNKAVANSSTNIAQPAHQTRPAVKDPVPVKRNF